MLTLVALLALLSGVWGANGTGLASSNDGSHVALARALALRGEARIDPDEALTLGIDLARREGHAYADRPPGTAWLAVPAAAIGARLDPGMWRRARARGALIYPPASTPFILTYARRFPEAPPLAGRQGTGLAASLHAILMGALGLALVHRRLRLRGHRDAVSLTVVAILGLATLWGPYATALFNHSTAAALVAFVVLGLDRLELGETGEVGQAGQAGQAGGGGGPRRVHDLALGAAVGAAAGLAVATDYLLAVVVVPLLALRAPVRDWPALLVGAAPALLALGLYHQLAFGSPWSLGYDHHAHFDFARTRAGTFSGDPVAGLWTLLGTGRGAGVLALCPVLLLAFAGLPAHASVPALSRRAWLAALPWLCWLALLATHKTPWGGEGMDHRYLVPLLPVAGVGLARLLSRAQWRGLVWPAVLGLALISAARVWTHLLQWRGGEAFAQPLAGAIAAGLVLAVAGLAAGAWALGRRFAPDRRSW